MAVCARIRNVIANTKDPVILHAMGAAITRCCNIALAVQDDYMGRINISVNTDTVPVVDDFEPLSEVCFQLIFSFCDLFFEIWLLCCDLAIILLT